MITPYNNMPLLTFFATHALAAVDKSKSPLEKAEEAFEIGEHMLALHTANRKTPGPMRMAGEVAEKKNS